MKYCPFCGAGLQETMIFCPKCGKRFLDAYDNPEVSSCEGDEVTTITQSSSGTAQPAAAIVDVSPVPESVPPVAGKRKRTTPVIIAAVLVLIAAVTALSLYGGSDSQDLNVDISQNPTEVSTDGSAPEIAELAQSVLFLETYDDTDSVIATASGFVVEDGATLVTNYHVIDGAHHIIAYTPDGQTSVDIYTVLSYDEAADLAILRCESNMGVQPLLLGNSDEIKQGNEIFAVGYPLGLANTMSEGIISSRYFDENGIDLLQITAAISHGSSGGALFNEAGEVVGVICAYYEGGQNLNLAVASNVATELLNATSAPISLAELSESLFVSSNANDYLTVSLEELYYSPDKYDGKLVSLTTWNAYYAYNEGRYQMYLINDKSCFLGNDRLLNIEVNEEEYKNVLISRYYTKYIEAHGIPYLSAKIYDRYIVDEIPDREVKITVYGRFTYNPEYSELGEVSDPDPFQLDVYYYHFEPS